MEGMGGGGGGGRTMLPPENIRKPYDVFRLEKVEKVYIWNKWVNTIKK